MILDATLSYNAIREMQDTRKFLTNASEELELLGTRRHLDAYLCQCLLQLMDHFDGGSRSYVGIMSDEFFQLSIAPLSISVKVPSARAGESVVAAIFDKPAADDAFFGQLEILPG
jgi:hypothetical protein